MEGNHAASNKAMGNKAMDNKAMDNKAMDNKVVIATRNLGKVKEFAEIFSKRNIKVSSLADYDSLPTIIEDGVTFGENALIKARTIALKLGIPVLADDSGLCVDALDGAPGVWSARFAGEQATAEMNNAKLLEQLQKSIPFDNGSKYHAFSSSLILSTARFVCALALYDPIHQNVLQAEGTCVGCIINEARGSGGFGYDPLFFLPELGLTMAELSVEYKNQISHRAKAMQNLLQLL